MLPTFGQHLHNTGDRHQQGVPSLLGGEIGRAGVIGNQVIQRVQRLIAAATGYQLDQNTGNIIELLHRSLLAALRHRYGASQRHQVDRGKIVCCASRSKYRALAGERPGLVQTLDFSIKTAKDVFYG
jgi:hypothetical protein